MMMSSEFLALRRGLMSLIREESLKAMGGEISEQGLKGSYRLTRAIVGRNTLSRLCRE